MLKYAHRIGKGIAKADFAVKREIVHLFDTQCELEYRDGTKIVHLSCVLREAA